MGWVMWGMEIPELGMERPGPGVGDVDVGCVLLAGRELGALRPKGAGAALPAAQHSICGFCVWSGVISVWGSTRGFRAWSGSISLCYSIHSCYACEWEHPNMGKHLWLPLMKWEHPNVGHHP